MTFARGGELIIYDIDKFLRIVDEISELLMHFGEWFTKSCDFEGLQGCLRHLGDFRQGGS